LLQGLRVRSPHKLLLVETLIGDITYSGICSSVAWKFKSTRSIQQDLSLGGRGGGDPEGVQNIRLIASTVWGMQILRLLIETLYKLLGAW
jgi:hypothetical protein